METVTVERRDLKSGLAATTRGIRAAIALVMALLLFWPVAARADDEDLPGRVGRVANVAGELHLAPQDQPDQWTAIGLNYPVAAGDNVWVGRNGRAEIDIGAGQFRLGGDTSLLLSRLDDRQFALFVAQGSVSLRVRVLDPGETAQIDTPNAQLLLTRPGLYRIEVAENRERTVLTVREGEVNVQAGGATGQVLPGQTATVEGAQPTDVAVRNGIDTDGFDTWVASRERYYDRSRTKSYVSRQMVGWADLEEYGTWDQLPEYGAVWYPSNVAADWAPYRNGYWTEVGAWGPTWVDYAPWGYAPFHYGRWAYIHGRWGWCPGAYVARPAWAPALVGWTGGPGWALSVSVGTPVYGWVPLGWGEPYRPWWRRCSQGCWERYNRPYAVTIAERPGPSSSPRYVNLQAPGGLSAMAGSTLLTRKPVQSNLVNVAGGMAASAPLLSSAPTVRPDAGRVPGRTPGNGVPPPASTFYPTLARPGNPAGGMSSTVPGSAAAGGVVAPRPSAPQAGMANAPAGGVRATPAPYVSGPNAGSPGTAGAAAGNALVRRAPTVTYPAAPTVAPIPTTGMHSRQPSQLAPPTAPHSAGAPAYAPAPTTNVVRPAARAQGIPVPPSMAAPQSTYVAPSPQLSRPAAPPSQVSPPAQLSRPSPVVPMTTPVAPVPRPVQVVPSVPASPSAFGGDAAVRSRVTGPINAVPGPGGPK